MFRIFFSLVELRTKVASILPFLIGTAIAYYTLGSLSVGRFFLMLVSLLCIDMATTGLNHYYDYKRAILKTGYHYEKHNPISSGELSPKRALLILIVLIAIGILSGLLLAWYTNPVVLFLGILSFAVGISYSVGPLPLSRTILGELFSGFFMGGLIPIIGYYIQAPKGAIEAISYQRGMLSLSINLELLMPLFFISITLMLLIGNIMLANNICDMEEDFQNKRFTLPLSIGKIKSLYLFKINIVISYLSLLLGVLLNKLPLIVLITFITIPSVYKNARKFTLDPVKSKTFKYAVKNFLTISIVLLFSFMVLIMIK